MISTFICHLKEIPTSKELIVGTNGFSICYTAFNNVTDRKPVGYDNEGTKFMKY